MNARDKAALAETYFKQGYNCAQAVALAFCEETGLSREQAARLASAFGGGMGRMREVCGALSGAFLVLGMLRGYERAEQSAEKAALYEQVRSLAARFREGNSSILCRDLIPDASVRGAPEPRTQAYYERRPCACYVSDAARLLTELLSTPTGA